MKNIQVYLNSIIIFLIFAATGYSQQEWDWGNIKSNYIENGNIIYYDSCITVPSAAASFHKKAIVFYKINVSPKQGQRCPCLPGCSSFTFYSMEKYGVVIGFFMGFERIYFRENKGLINKFNYLPLWNGYKEKIYDPPEANYYFGKKDWRTIDPDYLFNLHQSIDICR